MGSILMHMTPATGLSCHVGATPRATAPTAAGHGTGLSFAGTYVFAAQAAVDGVRSIDLPGPPSRGAPV